MRNSNEIKLIVDLDDNQVPEQINWSSTDSEPRKQAKAFLLSLWDGEKKETLHIDLWTLIFIQNRPLFGKY